MNHVFPKLAVYNSVDPSVAPSLLMVIILLDMIFHLQIHLHLFVYHPSFSYSGLCKALYVFAIFNLLMGMGIAETFI